ncbi:MAG: hypothetical protein RSB51_01705, partial [Clostridia bacterium]
KQKKNKGKKETCNMATMSISLYMLVFALLSALVLIIILLRPKPLYLEILENAVSIEDETVKWSSVQVRNALKEEKHFIGKNLSIYFDKDQIIFERLDKRNKVIQRMCMPKKDIISSSKSYDGASQMLHNGIRIYDNYYIEVIYKNIDQPVKLKMLFVLADDDIGPSDKVGKIRLNAYVDAISEKINDIGKKNNFYNETIM